MDHYKGVTKPWQGLVKTLMVIMKLDTKNTFGSLDSGLVLDVLSGKVSRDYEYDIKLGEDFGTSVHELRSYFGFFKLGRTCESILCDSVFSHIMGLRIT
jgi:hypothetical protein